MSKKYALVIGNTEYSDPGLAQLSAPGKDAEDFAHLLKDKEIAAFDDVRMMVNEPSSSVIEMIDGFFDQRKPDDLLVLYFSGHGIKDESGSLYLAFKNTVRSRLRSTAIKSDYIKEAMDQSRSKRQVLILDCCNSGAFPQGTKAEVGGAMGMTQAFQGYGRFVLTASDATQFAWEGDKVIGETENSLFTHFLVKGLKGEADSDGDGKITVDELYDYTYQEISKVTPKQTPTKFASKQEGEIILRQNIPLESITPIPLPPPLLNSIENPISDIRLGAVQQLTKLMNGKNLGLARSAKEALNQIANDDDSRQVSRAAMQALEGVRNVEKEAEIEKKKESELKKEQDAVTPQVPYASSFTPPSSNNTKQKPFRQSNLYVVGAIIIGLCLIGGLFGLISLWPSPQATETPPEDTPSTATESPIVEPTLTQAIETQEIVETPEVIEVTFWHAYGTGSAEEIALATILEQAAVDLPQYQINVLQIPFNDIFTKYDTDVAAGGGPDMFIAPNDNLGGQVRAGTIADITDLVSGKLGDYSELSQGGMMYDGKMYGIPESLKAVAFWYNKDILPVPPTTTTDLKNIMEGGTPIAISFGCYHQWGFYGSFGGRIFDSDYNFDTDSANVKRVANAMDYLNSLYQISVSNGWPRNDSDGLAQFTEGEVAAITNGNWAMGDYRAALGDKLAVAPIPASPGRSSNPLLGVDGFYFNPNSENKNAAIEVALYLSNTDSQQLMMDEAGHVPANTTVKVTDTLIRSLIDAFSTAYARPQTETMANYWGNFCGTDQVFDAGVSAVEWVNTAFAGATK